MSHPALEVPIAELTVLERITLLGRLWDSLMDEDQLPLPEWHRQELQRRVREADANPEESISLEELREQLTGKQS